MAERRVRGPWKGDDRRQGQDALSMAIPVVLISSWILLWVAWMFIYKAPPGSPLYLEFQEHEYWYGIDPMEGVMFALNALFVVSTTGFFISFKRRRRKGERPSIMLIVMLIMSFLGVAYMYLNF